MHRADLNDFVGATLLIVGAVLPVINPVGSAPLFLDMTDGLDPATRNKLAARVATYSFGLLLGSMLLGSFVLRFFDLSLPVVQVAGGAVVCALGWKLFNRGDGPEPAGTGTALWPPRDTMDMALYPLTLPLTVDPGAISVAITMGVNHAHGIRGALMRLLATVVSSGMIAAVILLTYRNAWRLGRWVGQRWMAIVFRLSAFIALCIGVQIVWNGAKALAAEIRLVQPAPGVISGALRPCPGESAHKPQMELASCEPHPGALEKRTGAPEETAAVRRDERGPRPPLGAVHWHRRCRASGRDKHKGDPWQS